MLRALRGVHLYRDPVRLNTWLPHGVLPIYGCPCVGRVLQKQIIEGRADDVVGKGWLEGRWLKGKREGTAPFICIAERRPRFEPDPGLACSGVTAEPFEELHLAW